MKKPFIWQWITERQILIWKTAGCLGLGSLGQGWCGCKREKYAKDGEGKANKAPGFLLVSLCTFLHFHFLEKGASTNLGVKMKASLYEILVTMSVITSPTTWSSLQAPTPASISEGPVSPLSWNLRKILKKNLTWHSLSQKNKSRVKDEGWDKFWGNYDPGWLRRPSRDHKSEGGGATLPASHMVCFVEEKMLDAQTEWFFVFVLDLSSNEASVNIESWKSYMGTSYIYVWRWKSSHINKSFNANNDIYFNMKLIYVLSVLAFLYGRSWGTGCVALLTLWAVWKNPPWPFL